MVRSTTAAKHIRNCPKLLGSFKKPAKQTHTLAVLFISHGHHYNILLPVNTLHKLAI